MQEALSVVAKKGAGGIERAKSWWGGELVAGEEARSRSRGQHLRCHACETRAERYGMEPGMLHLLCFLAGRIAQPG